MSENTTPKPAVKVGKGAQFLGFVIILAIVGGLWAAFGPDPEPESSGNPRLDAMCRTSVAAQYGGGNRSYLSTEAGQIRLDTCMARAKRLAG